MKKDRILCQSATVSGLFRMFLSMTLMAVAALGLCGITTEKNNNVYEYSGVQGMTGWSYASVPSSGLSDLYDNQIRLTSYTPGTGNWTNSAGIKFSLNQQNMVEGTNAVSSLRYWTADRIYKNCKITAVLQATVPLKTFIAYVAKASPNPPTYPAGGVTTVTSAQIAGSGGTFSVTNNVTLSNDVQPGDRIYFVLEDSGTTSGIKPLQTWNQTIYVEGPTALGVHAQSRGDTNSTGGDASAYLEKYNSISALSGVSHQTNGLGFLTNGGAYVRDIWPEKTLHPNATTWNWTNSDLAVATAATNGQSMVVCLLGLNTNIETNPAAFTADWTNYVQTVVNRYKSPGAISKNAGSIKGWEIWNEENTPDYLDSTGTNAAGMLITTVPWTNRANDYVTNVFIPAHDAIRSSDPYTPIIIGGMANGQDLGDEDNFMDDTITGFYRYVLNGLKAAGAQNDFDYAGIHPYVHFENVADTPLVLNLLTEEMTNDLGFARPISCTEFGGVPRTPPTSSDTDPYPNIVYPDSYPNDEVTQLSVLLTTGNVSQACIHYAIDIGDGGGAETYGLFNITTPQPTDLTHLNENDWSFTDENDETVGGTAWGYWVAIQELAGFDNDNATAMPLTEASPTDAVAYGFNSRFTPATGRVKVFAVWTYNPTGFETVQLLTGGNATSATQSYLFGAGKENVTPSITTSAASITGTGSTQYIQFNVTTTPKFIKVIYSQ